MFSVTCRDVVFLFLCAHSKVSVLFQLGAMVFKRAVFDTKPRPKAVVRAKPRLQLKDTYHVRPDLTPRWSSSIWTQFLF